MAKQDPTAFMSGEPGLGLDGARYLAELGVTAVGSDGWAVEALPFRIPRWPFPSTSSFWQRMASISSRA